MNPTWQHSGPPLKIEEETNMRFKLSNNCLWIMDWERCKYRKLGHFYREVRIKTGWEHFDLAWGKGRCPGAVGPGCRRRHKAVVGCIRSWTYGTFQLFRNKQAYFLPVSSCGFYSGYWRRSCNFSSSSFCSSLLLATARLSASALPFCVIFHAGQVKYCP